VKKTEAYDAFIYKITNEIYLKLFLQAEYFLRISRLNKYK